MRNEDLETALETVISNHLNLFLRSRSGPADGSVGPQVFSSLTTLLDGKDETFTECFTDQACFLITVPVSVHSRHFSHAGASEALLERSL